MHPDGAEVASPGGLSHGLSEEEWLEDDEAAVFWVLDESGASISQIADGSGFGKTKVRNLLKTLRDKGYVSVTGTGRSTRYHRVEVRM